MNRLLLLIFLFTYTGTAAQQVQLDISHVVGGAPMQLKTTTYHNAAGDTFNITLFRYYLSNFSFSDATGKTVVADKAYFLVSEDSARSKQLLLQNCSAGTYTHLSFMIGVDSVLNFSGPQSGALDPMYGMFWTWNSGYIMAKLEGFSPSSRLPNHMIQFHIGGYRTPHVTQRTVTLALPAPLEISNRTTAKIRLQADAATWFDGAYKVSFRQMAGFMTPGMPADRIADNYQHMFTVREIVKQ
jgi:hypothetical protein